MMPGHGDRPVQQVLAGRPVDQADPLGLGRLDEPPGVRSRRRAGPISRGSSQDVPRSPADRPMRTKAALNLAAGEASRMSAASARASPPPATAPLRAAMTGTRMARTADSARAACSWRSSMPMGDSPGSSAASARSSPAQNAWPAPVMIRTRRSSCSPRSSASCSSSANMTMVMAFIRSGRSRVATATPSAGRSRRMVSSFGSWWLGNAAPRSSGEVRRALFQEGGDPFPGFPRLEQFLFLGGLVGQAVREGHLV